MALISTTTIINSLAVFHLILAYYFLTSPSSIANHNLVVLLSMATGLPNISPSLSAPSALSSLLAAVLTFYSVADLAAASLHEEVSSYYWSTQAPIRLIFFFVLTASSYLGRPGGLSATRNEALALGRKGLRAEGISSGLVFTWAFVELIGWFWIYVTMRDERREFLARTSARKVTDEKSL